MTGRSPAAVSAQMALIRKRDTKPELVVRRLVHGMGYRFRLHRRDLPGTPDLVFPGRRKIILVHGCFWHRHDYPLGRKAPRARPEYWLPKFERNKRRDVATLEQLTALGWFPLVIWECEVSATDSLAKRLTAFLDGA
jgi:DNA mismatch endonuclease, patch repair protein